MVDIIIFLLNSSLHNFYFLNRLYAEFTRTPEHRNAKLIFKRNHVAAASQQKQVLVRLTGILQALLIYEKRVELLMELMSQLVSIGNVKRGHYTAV